MDVCLVYSMCFYFVFLLEENKTKWKKIVIYLKRKVATKLSQDYYTLNTFS
jgi:hypothetical protein